MNPRIAIASAAGLLLVAASVYYAQQAPSKSAASPAASPAADERGERVTPPRLVAPLPATRQTTSASDTAREDVSPAGPDAAGQTLRFGGEYESLYGLTVKKDRNCTPTIAKYITDAEGNDTPVYECKPHTERERHVYKTYPTEALRSLAYSDAEAAHELSDRLRGRDLAESARFAMRAAGLSGNTASIQWLLVNYPTPTNAVSETRVDVIADHYVLHGVLNSLRGSDDFSKWSARVAEREGNGIDRAALDAAIESYVRDIRTLRREAGIE